MRKAVSWLFTPLHWAAFFAVLLVFHVAQVIARPFGYNAHKRVVDFLNLGVLASLGVVGTRITVDRAHEPPPDVPLIIVSNHQSMFDIPLLGWTFRDRHPKYVAKIELARGFPSISYNLRHGGSVLIDRSDPKGSLREIQKFGKTVEANRYAACIFPEGTRAKDGVMKEFNVAGVMALARTAPSAVIVPVAIDGSWELMRYGMRPVPFGVRVKCTVLAPIAQGEFPIKELSGVIEGRIRAVVDAGRQSAPAPEVVLSD
jgi:1-acyl-sn-glycerol-3-phosphate acyltransferase